MRHLPTDLDPSSTDILAAADQPILWVGVVGVFGVIAAQTIIYFLAVRKAAPAVGMSSSDVKRSFRAGAVAAIGPSLAVALIAITLIAVFGTPGVLTRIGLIGSAAFDVAAAGVVAGTIATPLLKRGSHKLESRSTGKAAGAMAIIPTAALLGAFATFGIQQVQKGVAATIVVVVSALTMTLCLWLAKVARQPWLREWGLGISLVVGIVVGILITKAGIS